MQINKINNLVYPEVYLSKTIQNVMASMPNISLKEPVKPCPPSHPLKPEKENDTSSFGCCSLFVIIGFVILISNWDKMKGEAFTIIPLLFLLGLVSIPLFFSLLTNGDGYEEKLAKYYEELRQLPQKEKEYESLLRNYEQAKQQYQQMYDELTSPPRLSEFRSKIIREEIKDLQPYLMNIEETDMVKKGASEKYFEGLLEHCFCDDWNYEIITDQKIPVGDTFYFPDIVLKSSNGLYIDIEIDEPYDASSGEPIHYITNGLSIDYKRNMYFQEHGWVVVRFAEKQICENPKACVEFLLQVETSILNMSFDNFCVPDDFLCPKWDEKQSHLWAYRRYRDSYFPTRKDFSID